jgi:hypothetical protein
MKLTLAKITVCENESLCLTLREMRTSVLGSQRVKGSKAYLFFTPNTPLEVGEEVEIDLEDYVQEERSSTLEDGTEVSHIRLWLK